MTGQRFGFRHTQLEMPMRFDTHLDIYIYIWSFEDRAGDKPKESSAGKLSLKPQE